MKTISLAALTIALSLASFQASQAQSKRERFVPESGFYVIQSNVKTPKQSTIYFYTSDKQLVYKEQVEGYKINLDKKKDLLRLKGVLEQAVAAYRREPVMKQDLYLLAAAFSRPRQ